MSNDNRSERASGRSDLSRTVDVFATRIQRKKKEHLEQQDIEQQEKRQRQRRMLQVLANIRRSLIDVARINLGERFYFKLVNDDQDGWPRLTVYLKDSLDENAEFPHMQITAHDRQSLGIVQIYVGTRDKVSKASLQEQSEAAKLPALLKKCARDYLDDVGEVILKVEHAEEDQLAELDTKLEKGGPAAEDGYQPDERRLSSDLYSDDMGQFDEFEKLAPVAEIENLQGADDILFDTGGSKEQKKDGTE
jgi:hypothetical protein